MTKQEVKEKMSRFLNFVSREKELYDRLLNIKMQSKDLEVLKDRMKEHDRLIEEIDSIRNKNILPMARELCEFIAQEKKKLMEEKERQGEKITEQEAEKIMNKAAMDVMKEGVINALIKEMAPNKT